MKILIKTELDVPRVHLNPLNLALLRLFIVFASLAVILSDARTASAQQVVSVKACPADRSIWPKPPNVCGDCVRSGCRPEDAQAIQACRIKYWKDVIAVSQHNAEARACQAQTTFPQPLESGPSAVRQALERAKDKANVALQIKMENELAEVHAAHLKIIADAKVRWSQQQADKQAKSDAIEQQRILDEQGKAQYAAERSGALQLLELAVECAEDAPPGVKSVTSNKWIGDQFVFALTSETIEFVRNPNVGANSDSWEVVGSEVITTTEHFVHFSTIERALKTSNGITLECKLQKPCISEIISDGFGCEAVVSGGEICGNAGVSKKPQISIHAKRTISTICRKHSDDVGLSVAILSGGDNASLAGAYRVTAKDNLNVRQEAGTNSPVVAAIAPESGPVIATSCRNIAGYKSRWCQVKWGQRQGWVSQQFLAPF